MGTLKSSLLIRSRVSCMVHSLAQRIQRRQRILYSSEACHLFARIVTEGGARGNGSFDREFFWGTVHGLPAARASPPPKRCKHHHAFLGRGRACSLALAAPLQRPYNAPTAPLQRPDSAPTTPLQRPHSAPTTPRQRPYNSRHEVGASLVAGYAALRSCLGPGGSYSRPLLTFQENCLGVGAFLCASKKCQGESRSSRAKRLSACGAGGTMPQRTKRRASLLIYRRRLSAA
jgi:hypothetical protein